MFALNSGTIWVLGGSLSPPPVNPPAKVPTAPLPSVLPVADASGVIYFGCDQLVALDTTTKTILYPSSWTTSCWNSAADVSPLLSTEPALLVSYGRALTNYQPSTGVPRWSGELTATAGATLTAAALNGGTLYVASSEGRLYAVAVEGDLDSNAPWPMLQRNNRHSGNVLEPQ
jgi:outer membrane protein assembly factor BamB